MVSAFETPARRISSADTEAGEREEIFKDRNRSTQIQISTGIIVVFCVRNKFCINECDFIGSEEFESTYHDERSLRSNDQRSRGSI